jgi:hypothetical protein
MNMTIMHLFRTPALSAYQTTGLLTTAQQKVSPGNPEYRDGILF